MRSARNILARRRRPAHCAGDLRTAEPAARRAAARADGRAHAPGRPRGELLVPAPSGRLPLDRRSAAPAGGWSTWPAARATAPPCWPSGAAEVVGVDANPEAHEHARLRYTRAEPALRARAGRAVRRRRALGRDRLPPDDRARRPSRGALLERFAVAARARRRRLRQHAEPAHARARRAPSARATRGTSASTPPPSTAELLEPRFSRGRAARPVPRAQAARARAGAAARLGPGAPALWADAAASTTGSCRRSASATSRCAPAPLDRALDFLAVCRP